MPNGTPLTDPIVALSDVFRATQNVRRDVEWPDVAIAQVGATFDMMLGIYLLEQGTRYPNVDLWNGDSFIEFRSLVLRDVVPAVVNRAAESLPEPRQMTPKAFALAAHQITHAGGMLERIQQILDKCGHAARIQLPALRCPPFR